MLKRSGIILACVACACSKPAVDSSSAKPDVGSTAATVAVGSATTAPVLGVAPDANPGNPTAKSICEPTPLKLVTEALGQTSVMMQLSAAGEISGGLLGLSRPPRTLQFDQRGCILGGGDGVSGAAVWLERTSTTQMWSPRQLIRVEGNKIYPAKHSLTIEDDGTVVSSLDPDNITMRFEGYQPKALCAAQLMLMSALTMMPSMAAAEKLPPPTDSVCPEFHARNKP